MLTCCARNGVGSVCSIWRALPRQRSRAMPEVAPSMRCMHSCLCSPSASSRCAAGGSRTCGSALCAIQRRSARPRSWWSRCDPRAAAGNPLDIADIVADAQGPHGLKGHSGCGQNSHEETEVIPITLHAAEGAPADLRRAKVPRSSVVPLDAAAGLRGFEYRYMRFFYDPELAEFVDCGYALGRGSARPALSTRLPVPEGLMPAWNVCGPPHRAYASPSRFCDVHAVGCADINGQLAPLPVNVRAQRRTIFGENLINIREKSIPRLLMDEVCSPAALVR